MKLTVLTDNNTYIDSYYLGEPGVSFYIEDADKKILFDTGYSDVFLRNAQKMDIDLDQIDMLVISHGHNDHTGGLPHLLKEKKSFPLIAHPGIFDYKINEGKVISCPMSKEEVERYCELKLTKEPVKISEHITFLSEIPVSLDFEKRYALGKTEKEGELVDDYMFDDSAMVYQDEDGIFVITGCSHSGICNIIEYAKKVCREDRVKGVIGGFHLLKYNERVADTIRYLKDSNIPLLYPCHCVSLSVKTEMAKEMKIHEVGVSLKLNI